MRTKADLRVYWSKRERTYRDGKLTRGDLVYDGSKPTGGILASFFERLEYPDRKCLAAELDARGYDLTTLRFSIRKKATP